MCTIDKSIILSESNNSQFSWCKSCGMYSLVYHNCCASFNQNELEQFNETLHHLTDEHYSYQMLNQWFVIIKNPSTKVGLCLTKDDTKMMRSMIDRALNLHEVYSIVYSS